MRPRLRLRQGLFRVDGCLLTSQFLKNLVVAGNGLVRHFVNCCGVTCPREIERESVTAQYSYRIIEKPRETRQEETSTINRLRLDIGANDSNGQGYLRFATWLSTMNALLKYLGSERKTR